MFVFFKQVFAFLIAIICYNNIEKEGGVLLDRRYVFLFNEAAGNKESKQVISKIKKYMKKHQITAEHVHFIYSSSPESTKRVIHGLLRNDESLVVVACGGDGTVFHTANAIIGQAIIFSILPLGSGNDFYRTLYGKRTLTDQIAAIFTSSVEWTDAIYVEELDKYCLNITNVGIDAEVVEQAENIRHKIPQVTKQAYALGIPLALKNGVNRQFEIEAGITEESIPIIKGPYALAVSCNGGYYGSGFHVNPMANESDGWLELIYIPKVPTWRAPELIYKLFVGKIISAKSVYVHQVKWVRYQSMHQPLTLTLDGELFYEKQITLRVCPKCYQRIV